MPLDKEFLDSMNQRKSFEIIEKVEGFCLKFPFLFVVPFFEPRDSCLCVSTSISNRSGAILLSFSSVIASNKRGKSCETIVP